MALGGIHFFLHGLALVCLTHSTPDGLTLLAHSWNSPLQTPYNVGSRCEQKNLDVVLRRCRLLDEFRPRPGGAHEDLIDFVADRPGHDRRYWIDPAKIETELAWRPRHTFGNALRETVEWYLANEGGASTFEVVGPGNG